MADIFHHFPIKAPARHVFEAVSSPAGLDTWWTQRSSGAPEEQTEYQLNFGPGHDWRATVSRAVPDAEFELELTHAEEDWVGTRVGFVLEEHGGTTQVRFHHVGWTESTGHFRTSCYCWAMYLRLLKRYVEEGEIVTYERRLDV